MDPESACLSNRADAAVPGPPVLRCVLEETRGKGRGVASNGVVLIVRLECFPDTHKPRDGDLNGFIEV